MEPLILWDLLLGQAAEGREAEACYDALPRAKKKGVKSIDRVDARGCGSDGDEIAAMKTVVQEQPEAKAW